MKTGLILTLRAIEWRPFPNVGKHDRLKTGLIPPNLVLDPAQRHRVGKLDPMKTGLDGIADWGLAIAD
jgi:hypothetical protein